MKRKNYKKLYERELVISEYYDLRYRAATVELEHYMKEYEKYKEMYEEVTVVLEVYRRRGK